MCVVHARQVKRTGWEEDEKKRIFRVVGSFVRSSIVRHRVAHLFRPPARAGGRVKGEEDRN